MAAAAVDALDASVQGSSTRALVKFRSSEPFVMTNCSQFELPAVASTARALQQVTAQCGTRGQT